MIDILLITGNGFDRDLGFKSSYYDFMMSNSWKSLLSENNDGGMHALLHFLDRSCKNKRDFNLEDSLADYLELIKKGKCQGNPTEDKNDFERIKKKMTCYLKNEFEQSNNDYEYTVAGRLAKAFSEYMMDSVYTFNITDIDIIPFFSGGVDSLYANYVHKDNNNLLVLGVEDDCFNESIADYSFLRKSEQTDKTIDKMKEELMNAKEVVVFGLSFCKSDINYFYDYIQSLNKKQYSFRYFTIITKNSASKDSIVKTFDNLGVDIYRSDGCNTCVNFILTDNINLISCKPSRDYKLFSSLLERIDCIIEKK